MKRRYWTTAEDAILRRLYPVNSTEIVAEQIGRSERSIYARAGSLGLKKTAEYLAGPYSGRLRADNNQGGATRFMKGLTPWNKGSHFNAGGRSPETRFKAGNRSGNAAKNYKAVGTERMSKDGYLERKIHDGMPMQSRWRAVHLIEWEAINGPLPAGCALVFLDGNKANANPENMELVTRAELMRRNSYHNRYPKEVAELIQLRGALNRKIRSRDREEQNGRRA